MVRVRVWRYGKAGGGEEKRLGLREAGFDRGKGRGSAGEHHLGVLVAARVMWETMRWPYGNVDGQ